MEVSYDSNSQLPYTNNKYLYDVLNNPNVALMFLLIGIVVIYIILFSFLGTIGSNSSSPSSSLRIFELIIFVVFVIAVLMNLKYLSGNDISMNAELKNLFNNEQNEMEIHVSSNTTQMK